MAEENTEPEKEQEKPEGAESTAAGGEAAVEEKAEGLEETGK